MDKATLKLKTRDHLARLNSAMKDAIKARQNYQEKAAKLDKMRGEMYSDDYINGQIEKARQEYQAARASLWPQVESELDGLGATLTALHTSLDLNSPALVNAITLIKTLGKGLTSESAHAINNQFSGDIAALKLLQGAYRDAGVLFDGNIDRQVYSAPDAITAAAQYGSAAFERDGSLNYFSVQLARIAALEGHADFAERVADPAGLMENTYKAAGLKLNADGSIESL